MLMIFANIANQLFIQKASHPQAPSLVLLGLTLFELQLKFCALTFEVGH